MEAAENLLLNLLCRPHLAMEYGPSEWDKCLRMARHHRVLAKLSSLLEEAELTRDIAPKVLEHLDAARAIGLQHERIERWEAGRIERALAPTGIKVVLLKGAAYLMAGLPASKGRLYTDIDIMVPFDKLGVVESALIAHGWQHMKLNAYDQRYYRKWMHELPPLRHEQRHTVVDVHHTILPRTGRLHPDPRHLFESAVRLRNTSLWSLSPVDMVLHSAAHLFQDGDLAGGLRDLLDLDNLLRHFSQCQEDFWSDLTARAAILDLSRPLFYALRYTEQILGTPVPERVLKEGRSAAPPMPILQIMDDLVCRALLTWEPIHRTRGAKFARWCLYVRSHYLRMPPHLLLCHLLRKATVRN
jgi:hypothetical protein